MSPRLHPRAVRVALLAVALGCCPLSHATGPAPLTLTQLTRKAGYIFAGRVLRVERPAAQPDRVPVVQITLRVDQALRGVRRGQTFVLTQWAGAWENGPQYRPGQRLLVFLYPRGRTGLTSVVGGRLGQFELDAGGNIVLRTDQQRLLVGPGNRRRTTFRLPNRFGYGDFARRLQGADER